MIDDIPGALPHYSLDAEFEWAGRYKLFPQASAAWLECMRQDQPHMGEQTDDADEHSDETYDIEIFSRPLHTDFLPEEVIDSDSSYDATNIAKALRDVDKLQRQHTLASLDDARRKAKLKDALKKAKEEAGNKTEREHHYVDALLARLLPVVLAGHVFAAPSWRALAKIVAKAVGANVAIATKAISSGTPVFLVTHGTAGSFHLEINSNLTIEMLDTYPKTLEVCKRLLS